MPGLTLARMLDGPAPGSNATGTAGRLMGELRERISLEAEERRRVVVMVDEAQRLDGRALDDLRLPTNPERQAVTDAVQVRRPTPPR